MRASYGEGTVILVPLQNGSWSTGVIARKSRSGIMVVYIMPGSVLKVSMEMKDLELARRDAIAVIQVGHLGLKSGDWKIVGQAAHWSRDEWKPPRFVRYEELTGRTYLVTYDDKDPNKVLHEELVAPGVAEQGPPDGLMGAQYAERYLSRLLVDERLP